MKSIFWTHFSAGNEVQAHCLLLCVTSIILNVLMIILAYLAGDKVLKKVAMIFKSSIRTVDFIARIGGEEFVFIFEQTSSKEAFGILEKLRKLVEDCLFYYRDKKVDVTVSFGLTTVTEEDDIESLFMRADNAMYKAKNAGKNRVEIL